MKNLASVLMLLAFALSLACCKKTETSPASGSVTFKVDSTTSFTSSLAGGTWEPNNSLLNITAKGGKSLFTMTLAMPNGLKAGTYAFSSTTSQNGTLFKPDTAVTQNFLSNVDTKSFGTLVISNVTTDSLITGTFTFTLKDPVGGTLKKITVGVINNVKAINNKSITTSGSTFSAKIDGTLWTPTQVTGLVSSNNLIITASDGTKSIGFTLPSNIAVGSYTFDFFTGTYIALYNPTNSTTNPMSFIASTATSKLTITEKNTSTKQIKGTFNFKGEDITSSTTRTYLITEGTFSVKY